MKNTLLTLFISLSLFTFAQLPSLTSISPASGNAGDNVTIAVVGQNITTAFDTTGNTSMYLGKFVAGTFVQISLSGLSGTSGTQISGSLNIANNATPGLYNVYYARGLDSASLANAFEIVSDAPIITSISPASGVLGDNLNITVTGFNITTDISETTSLYLKRQIDSVPTFVQIDLTALSGTSGTQISGNLNIENNATPGVYTLHYERGSESTSYGSFEILESNPVISSVSPAVGGLGNTYTVTVAGDDITTDMSQITSMYLGKYIDSVYSVGTDSTYTGTYLVKIDLTSLSGTSGTQISGSITIDDNASLLGSYTLYYERGSGSTSLANAFEVVQAVGFPVGPFSITGAVYEGSGKQSAEGDPVSNVTLFLKEEVNSSVVGQSITNVLGEYSFENLPEGQYSLHYENSNSTNPIIVTLSSTNPSTEVTLNLSLKSDGTIEELSVSNSIDLLEDYGIKLDNTIINNNLIFSVKDLIGTLNVSVYSIMGSKVVSNDYLLLSSKNSIDFSDFPKGYYFVKFNMKNSSTTYKVIKK